MSLSHEHVGPKILGKIKIYVLTRAELLFPLCYEIPCTIVFICTLSLYNFSTIKIWGKHRQIYCTVCNSFISLTIDISKLVSSLTAMSCTKYLFYHEFFVHKTLIFPYCIASYNSGKKWKIKSNLSFLWNMGKELDTRYNSNLLK